MQQALDSAQEIADVTFFALASVTRTRVVRLDSLDFVCRVYVSLWRRLLVSVIDDGSSDLSLVLGMRSMRESFELEEFGVREDWKANGRIGYIQGRRGRLHNVRRFVLALSNVGVRFMRDSSAPIEWSGKNFVQSRRA